MKNSLPKFNIVLVEPEIPQNTGNIIRLCACTGADLFLVGKLGFSLTDKYLKRSGMDYVSSVNINRMENLDKLQKENLDANFYFLTTKSKENYFKTTFKEGDFLVFGPESRGLEESLLIKNSKTAITIPMNENQRSLNLANSVSIVLYEAIRQNNN